MKDMGGTLTLFENEKKWERLKIERRHLDANY